MGNLLWQHRLDGSYAGSTPAVDSEGTVYTLSYDGRLGAVKPSECEDSADKDMNGQALSDDKESVYYNDEGYLIVGGYRLHVG
jgi:hypothetical protein